MKPLQVPQRGLYGERCLFPVPSFTYTLGSPVKESPPCSPHRPPTERDAPFPQLSFISLSRVPSKRKPLQVPQRGPYGEICPFPQPSFMHLLDSPIKVLLTEKSHPYFKVPGKGASPPCSPKGTPMETDARFHSLI
jgi:hypothetical protein